jgi:hypothetical protein
MGETETNMDFDTFETIKHVKHLRQLLDAGLQEVKNYSSLNISTEGFQAELKLKESIMWLGLELERLGEANPSPNSYNPESAIVDKSQVQM